MSLVLVNQIFQGEYLNITKIDHKMVGPGRIGDLRKYQCGSSYTWDRNYVWIPNNREQ